MTIKDLVNNEELVNSIVEDLEDFDENTEVVYEVWAFGYDENDEITDAELCMFNSTDPEEAVNYAKTVELADVIHEAGNGPCSSNKVFRIAVEVETVVPVDDDLVNVGTIYSKTLWEEPTYDGPEEDEDDDDCVVALCPEDYEVLEDNTLKVKCEALLGFNKNDAVMIVFPDDPNSFPIVYKIMSRVMYADGDYYHCELDF
jgi:hypothetical protein